MNAADILARFIPLDAEASEFEFTDEETGRIFNVHGGMRSDGVAQFFLCEICPTGRMTESDGHGMANRSWVEPRIKLTEEQYGPNGLLTNLRALGVDVAAVAFSGAGQSVNSIYYASLAACADVIEQVLTRNERYVSTRPLTSEETASLRHRDAVQTVEYWHTEADAANEADQHTSGLFKGCHNIMGPLSPEYQREILAYLNSPTQSEWLRIRSVLITATSTLWKAWITFDSTAPRSGDDGYPGPDVLRQAIRHAVEQRQQEIAQKVQEVGPRGLRSV